MSQIKYYFSETKEMWDFIFSSLGGVMIAAFSKSHKKLINITALLTIGWYLIDIYQTILLTLHFMPYQFNWKYFYIGIDLLTGFLFWYFHYKHLTRNRFHLIYNFLLIAWMSAAFWMDTNILPIEQPNFLSFNIFRYCMDSAIILNLFWWLALYNKITFETVKMLIRKVWYV